MGKFNFAIDDYVNTPHGIGKILCLSQVNCIVEHINGIKPSIYPIQELKGLNLNKGTLISNGWEWKIPNFVLKNESIRLGWNPKTNKFYIGYGELSIPVEYIHQLQHIYRDCGIEDTIKL